MNKKILLLTWKKVLIIIALWFVFVVLHNAVSALAGFEEALFFILAVAVLPIYFIVSLIYSVVVLVLKFLKK